MCATLIRLVDSRGTWITAAVSGPTGINGTDAWIVRCHPDDQEGELAFLAYTPDMTEEEIRGMLEADAAWIDGEWPPPGTALSTGATEVRTAGDAEGALAAMASL